MRLIGVCFVWALLVSCPSAFIIPEELVSFLSIVYSNIPPIKKGTDSRVGVGFRLGPHADAQIVLELGPQTNTQALGAAGPSFGTPAPDTRKRHTLVGPLDDPLDAPPSNPAAGDWLTAWRTSIAARRPSQDDDLANQADLSGPGPIGAPDPTKLSGAPLVTHLRKLYRKTKQQPEREPDITSNKWPSQPSTLTALHPSNKRPSQPEPSTLHTSNKRPSQPEPSTLPTSNKWPSQPSTPPTLATQPATPTLPVFKASKRSKVKSSKVTSTRQPSTSEDLSDVSLDD